MPTLVKLIALFGPGELEFYSPRGAARDHGEVRVFDRHRIDSVIYARKTWGFDGQQLISRVAGVSRAESFILINRWRMEHEIPEQIFLIEPMAEGSGRVDTKPQYIDFTSPSLVSIFLAALKIRVPLLYMQEILPVFSNFTLAPDGKHWATEIQVENTNFVDLTVSDQPAFTNSVKAFTSGLQAT